MKLFFNSLGCDKTLSDSEHIMGNLESSGLEITENIAEADIIAINTCCFILDALEESINAVLEASKEKKQDAKIVVFGCMAKRFQKNILETLPEVDLLIPNTDIKDITEEIVKVFNLGSYTEKRINTQPSFYAYLKIAEGCDKHCTYCVIPSIKGSYHSIPMDALIDEAKYLSNQGVNELIIIAQETTIYGTDLYGKKSLHILLDKLSEIEGIKWIRLMYAYPEEIYDELIETIKTNKKVLHYIDMPIQHCNDRILKKMARRTSKADIINIITKLRNNIPDICLRTTLISGFPGETIDEHKELLSFIEEYRFDRLGVFAYSKEEGTPAFDFEDQIPDEIKNSRRDELMKLQDRISNNNSLELKEKVLKCIVEGYLPQEDIYQARSYLDAPDVDGLVFFKSNIPLISGEFINVVITDTYGYDLMGKIYEPT